MRTTACPKCQGKMEEGLVMTNVQGGKLLARWAEGPIRRGWLRSLKLTGKPIDMTASRCGRCGYVELFAKG